MYVRLAFAVAAHLEPEILIVDEVLAVGDAEFQKKCLGKMHDIATKQGRTVLFVSHNMGAVRTLCERAIYLGSGKIIADSDAHAAVNVYLQTSSGMTDLVWRAADQKTGVQAAVVELSLRSESGNPVSEIVMGDKLSIALKAKFFKITRNPQFRIFIHSGEGKPVLDLRTTHTGFRLGEIIGNLEVKAGVDNVGLYPGDYLISAMINDETSLDDLDWIQFAVRFRVLPRQGPYGDMRLSPEYGMYYVPVQWKAEYKSFEVSVSKET
jgi:lipopolysaccharide transport system ATP-binding protein